MEVEEVEGIEGVRQGVMGLLRLWKCVEKSGKEMTGEWWGGEVVRRTRLINGVVAEKPHNYSAWDRPVEAERPSSEG